MKKPVSQCSTFSVHDSHTHWADSATVEQTCPGIRFTNEQLDRFVEQSVLLNRIGYLNATTLGRIVPPEDYTAKSHEELMKVIWDDAVALVESQRQWKAFGKG